MHKKGFPLIPLIISFQTMHSCWVAYLNACLLDGWVIKAELVRCHINNQTGLKLVKLWDWSIKLITPIILGIILSQTIITDLDKNYGNYSDKALWIFGGGIVAITISLAIGLTLFKWRTPKPNHKPEDEHLLT